jgi:cyclophilin family peptidyl-prolyl cis-trans isomerase
VTGIALTSRRAATVLAAATLMLGTALRAHAADKPTPKPLTTAEIIEHSAPSDWRALDPQQTLYLELPAGRVIIELAPQFAPRHVANILALVRESYFDGLAVMRVQDNYVVQWGDADGKREIRTSKKTLNAEFDRPAKGVPFTALPDPDTYAAQTGFSDGFATARDSATGTVWLTHCYGAVGAGRDTDANSGGGTELYAVIGHSPRHLDRNVTLVGRVVKGIELFSVLPRGTGALGFYEKPEQRVPLRSVRVAADVPEAERTPLEIFRTDTPAFTALVESRRTRTDEWFKYKVGHIELCNVPIPVRESRKR